MSAWVVGRADMPTLQQQIAEKFLAKLEAAKSLDTSQLERLRTLMSSGKKLKAEELMKIFAQPEGGDLK